MRTDLALEAQEELNKASADSGALRGVKSENLTSEGFPVTRINILDENGAEQLGKPVGAYITVTLDGLKRRDEDIFSRAINAVAKELRSIVPEGRVFVLIVGLGNDGITPDAIGHDTVKHIMVTRHLVERFPDVFGRFREVSAIAPGVLGTTGVESREIIRGVVSHVHPDFVIVVDALASSKLERLCKTIQMTDTGIIPGSGVGNSRAAVNRESMGVPVIAIGVPTVVDIKTVVYDVMDTFDIEPNDEILKKYSDSLMVTPKEIDVHISDMGRIIGYAINLVLHDNISIYDMDMFLS